MTFAAVLASLPATVRRHEPTYASARTTDPAFAPHGTALLLLEALELRSPLAAADRQRILQAVLRRHRSGPHPLWQALLLGAFAPLLHRLCARSHGDRNDRRQRVLFAFLRAIGRARTEARPVVLAIRDATFRELHAIDREEACQKRAWDTFDEESGNRALSVPSDPSPFVVCLAREVADRLARHTGGDDMARVLAGVESVSEQAARLSDAARRLGCPPVRVACIERRRHRAVHGLRAELGVR